MNKNEIKTSKYILLSVCNFVFKRDGKEYETGFDFI